MFSGYYRAHGLIQARNADSTTTKKREDLETYLFTFEEERQRQGDFRQPKLELTFFADDYYEIHVSFRVTYKDRNADIDEYVEDLLKDLESQSGIIVTDFEIEQIVPERSLLF